MIHGFSTVALGSIERTGRLCPRGSRAIRLSRCYRRHVAIPAHLRCQLRQQRMLVEQREYLFVLKISLIDRT